MHLTEDATKLRVLVIEPIAGKRSQISDAVRQCGFKNITVAATVQDALAIITGEENAPDWIISSSMLQEKINAIHLLGLCIQEKKLHQTKISLLVKESELFTVESCFELGLFSWHPHEANGNEILLHLKELLSIAATYDDEDSLVAAYYLRRLLNKYNQLSSLLTLQRQLIAHFHHIPRVLLDFASILFMHGKRPEALATLARIRSVAPDLQNECDKLSEEFFSNSDDESAAKHGGFAQKFGLNNAVIIDSDASTVNQIELVLQQLGIVNISKYADGKTAWEKIKTGLTPDVIIQEWRLAELPGNILVQRIRQAGFTTVPIIVYSALVKKQDLLLLKEMGVSDIIEKPQSGKVLRELIRNYIEQELAPQATRAIEQKIQKLCAASRVNEGKQLYASIKNDEQGQTFSGLEALFAFHDGRMQDAKTFAIQSLQESGESLPLLTLLTKIFSRLRDYDTALKFLERANQLNPQNVARLCELAELNSICAKPEEAEKALDEAKKLDDDNSLVETTDAKLRLQRGESIEAKEIDSSQGFIAYLNNCAVSLVGKDKLDEAVEFYKRALKSLGDRFPESKGIVGYNLALALIRQGNTKDAHDFLLQCQAEKYIARAKGLEKRLAIAIKKNEPMQLNLNSDKDVSLDSFSAPQNEFPHHPDLKIKDRCLYLIFKNIDGLDPRVAPFAKNLPKLNSRQNLSWKKAS